MILLLVLLGLAQGTSASCDTYVRKLSSGTKVECKKCEPGQRVLTHCDDSRPTGCVTCPTNQFNSQCTQSSICSDCHEECESLVNEVQIQPCTAVNDLICGCSDGMFRRDQYQPCKSYTACKPGYGVIKAGTKTSDAECSRCPEGTYSSPVNNFEKCKPHRECTGKLVTDFPGNSTHDRTCKGGEMDPGTLTAIITVSCIAFLVLIGVGIFCIIKRISNADEGVVAGGGENGDQVGFRNGQDISLPIVPNNGGDQLEKKEHENAPDDEPDHQERPPVAGAPVNRHLAENGASSPTAKSLDQNGAPPPAAGNLAQNGATGNMNQPQENGTQNAAQELHYTLLRTVKEYMVDDDFKKMKTECQRWFKPAELERIKDTCQLLTQLEKRGCIKIGCYDALIRLLVLCNLLALKQKVEKLANEIARLIQEDASTSEPTPLGSS